MDFLTIEYILKACCAIAGVYMIVGTIGVYIAIHNWLFRPLNLA